MSSWHEAKGGMRDLTYRTSCNPPRFCTPYNFQSHGCTFPKHIASSSPPAPELEPGFRPNTSWITAGERYCVGGCPVSSPAEVSPSAKIDLLYGLTIGPHGFRSPPHRDHSLRHENSVGERGRQTVPFSGGGSPYPVWRAPFPSKPMLELEVLHFGK